jgi:transcriptional regulator with XRE-family HTH domain
MSSPTHTSFDQEQVQKLTEIGTFLQNLRAKKGMSLEEISTKTMVQQRFLDAIEKGEYEQLPEPLYIRGFIRRFAEALGIDGIPISESFPLGNVQAGSANSKFSAANTPLRPWHLYVLYFAAVLGAVALLYALFKPSESPSGNLGTSRPSATVSASNVPKKAVAPIAPAPKPKAAPVQAKLSLKADSYMTVQVDGQPNYEGTLKAGENKTFTAKKSIQISAGNAGGVMLGINGLPGKIMGQPGEVKDVTLTPTSK